jgi:hypothetical protein
MVSGFKEVHPDGPFCDSVDEVCEHLEFYCIEFLSRQSHAASLASVSWQPEGQRKVLVQQQPLPREQSCERLAQGEKGAACSRGEEDAVPQRLHAREQRSSTKRPMQLACCYSQSPCNSERP